MKNLQIGTRLVLGYAILVALLAVMALFGLAKLARMEREIEEIVKSNCIKSKAAADALTSIQSVYRSIDVIVLETGNREAQAKERELIEATRASYGKAIQLLEEKEAGTEGKTIIATMKQSLAAAVSTNNKVMETALAGSGDEARALLIREANPLFGPILKSFNEMSQYQQAQIVRSHGAAVASYMAARNGFITLFAAAVFTAILIATVITRSIVRPIRDMQAAVEDLAQGEGDLTHKIDLGRKDELGRLGDDLNLFVTKLHDMVKMVVNDSMQVVMGSNKVQVMAEKIGKEAEDLTLQSTAVSTASEEMSATACDIARNCLEASEGGSAATSAATAGSAIVRETVDGMDRIAERVRGTAATVETLGARSDQIGLIVGTIQDIADQTNLLALNAAIEAARAGEQGRGFAVVADEVRALAERTSRATGEISNMIRNIQEETRSAVESMELGVSEVRRGSEDAARSGEALRNILDQINSVNMQISQIATAAEEQTATTMEISGSIQQVSDIAQKAKEHIQQTSVASNNMLTMSEDLMAILGKFKLNEDLPMVLNRAKCAHMLFVGKIKSHLLGYKKVDPNNLPTHLTCAFGKWYQSKGKESCGHSALFREIDGPHARVHELGKQAIMAFTTGDRERAMVLCEEMTDCSTALIDIIDRLAREC